MTYDQLPVDVQRLSCALANSGICESLQATPAQSTRDLRSRDRLDSGDDRGHARTIDLPCCLRFSAAGSECRDCLLGKACNASRRLPTVKLALVVARVRVIIVVIFDLENGPGHRFAVIWIQVVELTRYVLNFGALMTPPLPPAHEIAPPLSVATIAIESVSSMA